MSRYPDLSTAAAAVPISVFARLNERLARFQGDVIPFQIGDTHVPPPPASRLGALGFSLEHEPDLYAYSPPQGDQALMDAVAAKVRAQNGLAHVHAGNVQITNGATHALYCAARTVMDPGDEILLLAPYWPLIRNVTVAAGIKPVDVVFSHELLRHADNDHELAGMVAGLIEPHITERTTTIYVATPNNPDGCVLGREVLGAIAQIAQRHNLWVLSDEVYEDFTYDGRRHVSIASLPGMAERTLACFSFSKSYAQAGLRVGYVVGPEAVIHKLRRMANASVYSVSRAMQRAALRALEHGAEFLAETRAAYQEARDQALRRIDAPCRVPQGSTYLFLDLSPWVVGDIRSSLKLLERMADAGLMLAPGTAFGEAFGNWARLCFTAVAGARLDEGLDRLNRVLAGARAGRRG